jgi:NAD(P)-dependent dehydrogenase (short-subunit alcohol dehydrogenase family)
MKTILITGVCGGMGQAICNRMLQKGYQVYGLDCQKREAASGMHFIQCDITSAESVEAAFERVKMSVDRIDAIVHTAGIYDLDSLLEMEEERFRRIFEINLFGVYRVNKIFTPILDRGGRIIITTSELAPLDPLPFTGIYAVTKAALEKYAYSLRMEVNLLGISVSVIRPGAVKTSLLRDSTQALDRFCDSTQLYHCNAEKFRRIVDRVEAKHVAPEVIADIVCKALESRHPKLVYNVNRNILLKLLNLLPDSMQTAIIKRILRV